MFEPIERHREDVLHAWRLARNLHDQVPAEAAALGGASFRHRVEREPALAALDPLVKRRLHLAAEMAPTLTEELLTLARTRPFREDPALAQSALEHVRGSASRVQLLRALAIGLERPGLIALAPHHRRLALEVIARGVEQAALSRALEGLLEDEGFCAAGLALRTALLEHLVGPALSPEIAPMRRNRMASVWASRAKELEASLSSKAYQDAPPALRVERLRDFLHAPSREVVFLDATPRNGHALVVFGDPSDRAALSYGRRWVLASDRRPRARLHAPDPSHHSGWTRPMSDASVEYFGRAYRISRHEERQLIGFVEAGHVFHDDLRARGLGARRVGGTPVCFVERAEAFLVSTTAARAPASTKGIYLAGRKRTPRRPRPRAAGGGTS